jgi:hypothetical protein
MKLLVKKGATSKSVDVFIRDSSLTTGAGKTGLAYNTASLVAYYRRPGAAATAITLATLANAQAAYSSGGFVEVDATNMPGVYRLDIPDAALATGVNEVVIMLKGAANMEPVVLEIQLTDQAVGDANVVSWLGTACATPTVNGVPEVDVTHIDGSATAAQLAKRAFDGLTLVTVGAGSTSTSIATNLTEATNDHYKGKPLYFLTGNLAKQLVEVTAYNGTTKALTVTATPTGESPAENDLALLG